MPTWYLKCNDCGEVWDEMSVVFAQEHLESEGCQNDFSIVSAEEAF